MKISCGTSGYSYKEWKGNFYPEDLSAPKMLGYYAERLKTVEINNTFYRMPKQEVVQAWAEQVPDGFTFALKASQRITHKKRLEDAGDELGYVVKTASELGDKLGPMLFQLPPWLKLGVERLKGFLAILPEGFLAAFEFRHESWFCDEVYDALREKNAALVWSDDEKRGEPPLVTTAGCGYVRLRRPTYDETALDAWAERVKNQPWDTAHVFFKHEDDGAGPKLAKDFAARF